MFKYSVPGQVHEYCAMGWLRSIGSIKLKVPFAEYCLCCRAFLQKRHIILSILLTKATPYWAIRVAHCKTLQHTWNHCNTIDCRRCKWPTPNLTTHCNTLQHTATRCNALQLTATHCNTIDSRRCKWPTPNFTTHCNTLQHTATRCNTLQLTATRLILGDANGRHQTSRHTATYCNTLQHTTTHYDCSTLRHAATRYNTQQVGDNQFEK